MHAAIVQLHQIYSAESQIERNSYQSRPWNSNFIHGHVNNVTDVIEEFLIPLVSAINRGRFFD